jgi:hypothetical protein
MSRTEFTTGQHMNLWELVIESIEMLSVFYEFFPSGKGIQEILRDTS